MNCSSYQGAQSSLSSSVLAAYASVSVYSYGVNIAPYLYVYDDNALQEEACR